LSLWGSRGTCLRMIIGRPGPLRPYRATLTACLSLLTLCAPMMVVCEGAEHATTEWVFSSCCAPLDARASADASFTPAKGQGRSGGPSGRCADHCVDTPLLASAPEPTVPPSADAGAFLAPVFDSGAIAHLVASGREPIAPASPPPRPRAAAFSTALLI
jgi:hypothetical protein